MTDNFRVDLSNYRDRVGGRVTPGRYNVVVDWVEPDQSRAGDPMLVLSYRIIDAGPHQDATIVDRLTQTPNALFRTVNFLQAIGLPTPRKALSINLRQIAGKVLTVEVADGQPYRDQVKSEVRAYFKAESKGQGGGQAQAQQSDEFGVEEEAGQDEAPAPTAAPKAQAPAARQPAAATDAFPEDAETLDLETIDF